MKPSSQPAPDRCATGPLGQKLCKCGCGQPIGKGRRSWASQACVDGWLVRNSAPHQRRMVFERDHGICARCGLDSERMQQRYAGIWEVMRRRSPYNAPWRVPGERWKRCAGERQLAVWLRREPQLKRARASRMARGRAAGLPVHRLTSWWEAHHKVAVAEGGGGCGLDGLETLCVVCHAKETGALRRRLNRKNGTQ